MRRPDRPRARRSQGGHLLIMLMVGITVMMIMLTVAAQSWTFQMRREMELELIHRGEQYVRALERFRAANGGAFPVGDLKVLSRKTPQGIRFIRRLYKNPFDPNGTWQYLYLHPGGSGFINPCAKAVGGMVGGQNAFVPGGMPGMMPGVGMPGTGLPGTPGGLSNRRLPKGSNSRGIRGIGLEDDDAADLSDYGDTTAMDPKIFKKTGMAKMNLPIVGVVNCEQRESIRTYRGQAWLSNWAFTPLAQGEFAPSVATAGGAKATLPATGIGAAGSEFWMPGQETGIDSSGRGGVYEGAPHEKVWRRQSSDASPPEQPPDLLPCDPNDVANPNDTPCLEDPNSPGNWYRVLLPPDPNRN